MGTPGQLRKAIPPPPTPPPADVPPIDARWEGIEFGIGFRGYRYIYRVYKYNKTRFSKHLSYPSVIFAGPQKAMHELLAHRLLLVQYT